jgi:hypothetical protein
MNQLIKLNYFVTDSTVEYEKATFELIPNTRHDTFDSQGNEVQVYYKRQKFPDIFVTVGNVTKRLQEINQLWRENNRESSWSIDRDENSALCIFGEFYSSEHATYFMGLCDQFIKEVFHL